MVIRDSGRITGILTVFVLYCQETDFDIEGGMAGEKRDKGLAEH